MKYILSLLLLLLLNGCTVAQPPISEYRIVAQINESGFDAQSCKDKSLKISQAFSANSLMSQKMKYAQDEYGEYAFSESEWSRTPNGAITEEITKSVRASKLFKSVQGYKSRAKSDYILENNIEEFIQYFSNDAKSSYSSVIITMSLVDTKSGETLDTHTMSKTYAVKEMNAQGGVKALNEALSDVLQQSNIWLNEVCK
jgi:cholesterol transport system auxiliary component